jgi:hypothetical protein
MSLHVRFTSCFLGRTLTISIRGQLCTDLEEVIQAQYHQQIFAALIPTLEVPEPRYTPILPQSRASDCGLIDSRVHAHAAAALINFCEGVERDTLLPYLDPIVDRLLKLLNPVQEGSRPTKRYVQEQAVTTLAMVADASETTFAKVRVPILRDGNATIYLTIIALFLDHAAPAQRTKKRKYSRIS